MPLLRVGDGESVHVGNKWARLLGKLIPEDSAEKARARNERKMRQMIHG